MWSRDGKWIVFQSNGPGVETDDLFAIPSNGGEVLNLTDTPNVSETNPVWSPDGTRLAILYKVASSPVYDIAVFDWKTHQVHNVTQEKTADHAWIDPVWSPDSNTIYAIRYRSDQNDSNLYRIDLATSALENLTPHDGDRRTMFPRISPDGHTFLVSSDDSDGYLSVALLDTVTHQIDWVTNSRSQAIAGGFSPDGRQFAYSVNDDGRTDVYLADTSTRRSAKIMLPVGQNTLSDRWSPFNPHGGQLLISHESSTQPRDLWVYTIPSRNSRQLTFSAIAGLRGSTIPSANLVHYRSFDNRVISAFMWVPFNVNRDSANPGIVIAHGGPIGQSVDSFDGLVAALVTRGYVCIAPNVRGSSGYGMAFQKANTKDIGGGDLQDEVYAAKFLTASGFVDAKKIGITGISYGGTMTLMAVGKAPDVWAAGVEALGILDWRAWIEHSERNQREYFESLLGDPIRDEAIYEKSSFLTYIRNAKAPLLALYGDDDPQLSREQAEHIVSTLKAAGLTVEAHYYSGEGHGFSKREDQIDVARQTVNWFDRYLKSKN